MTALPTPEALARECYDEPLDKIAAAIRADRLRIISEIERRWEIGEDGMDVLDRLRREIAGEEPGT